MKTSEEVCRALHLQDWVYVSEVYGFCAECNCNRKWKKQMPPILDRLVKQLKAKGKSKEAAYAIATSSLQRAGDLKKGSTEATSKGKRRGSMSPGERAKDRAAKYSNGKHSTSAYTYDKKTNLSKLKHKQKNMNVVADKVYPNMYRLQWPNGDLSLDFYNLPRANSYSNQSGVQRLKRGETWKLSNSM